MRVLAHSRASPRPETYHPPRPRGRGPRPDRPRPPHCPRLPAWFMVWFVIALGLFCRDCYRQVFHWLQPFRNGGTPGRSTFCEARKRLGVAPMRLLAEQVIRLQGKPPRPGAFYRGMRTMALDGFVVDVPDTPANDRAFGRPGSSRAPAAFPQARVLALCETGSHVLWRSLIKPCSCGEVTMAHYLLRFLQKDMLLLWDRNFLSYQTVCRGAPARGASAGPDQIEPDLRADPGAGRRLVPGQDLPHASDRREGPRRHPGADHRVHLRRSRPPGSGEPHRLLTTLLDEKLDPAETLIVLYHERWEEELTIDELKTHQRERPVLRSQTPGGVVQELYGLLLGHYVIRVLMQEAAATQGIDPQRLSFTGTLKILRCRLPECPASRRGLQPVVSRPGGRDRRGGAGGTSEPDQPAGHQAEDEQLEEEAARASQLSSAHQGFARRSSCAVER